ncbi:MAG: hypothetical protein PHW04_06845 [Candidatus Wallbacteria bacterium]|nr:hypothetical protein [Candidatus Wallbacteria bacterium]
MSTETGKIPFELNRRDNVFIFSWKVSGIPQHITLTSLEFAEFLKLISDAEKKLERSTLERIVKNMVKSSLTLCSDLKNKGELKACSDGMLEIRWKTFSGKYSYSDFKSLVSLLSASSISTAGPVKSADAMTVEGLKTGLMKFYFYSGICSFCALLFMLAVTFGCFLFAPEAVKYPAYVSVVLLLFLLVFILLQSRNIADFRENLAEDFRTGLLPVLHALPVANRKFVEFFIVLILVGIAMGISFAKCIPFIIERWKNLMPNF